MRANIAIMLTLLLAAASPALAEGGNVAQLHFQTLKPGMAAKYAAARKKHMAWHKKHQDTWSWTTWEVMTGDHAGMFITGTFGHDWKDFDPREKLIAEDNADAEKSMGATVASESMSFFVHRADMGLEQPPSDPPSKFLWVQHFVLKPDSGPDFANAAKKIRDAIKKTNWPQKGASHWFQLVNGGVGPHYVLVSERADFASMAPNEKSMDAMVEEAYGKEEGAAVMASARRTFQQTWSELVMYRADLSYAAPKAEAAAEHAEAESH
jgi:hypothetical protein